jgi:hypothetical protein
MERGIRGFRSGVVSEAELWALHEYKTPTFRALPNTQVARFARATID